MNADMKTASAANRRRLFELLPENSAVLLQSAPQKIRSGDTPYAYCQNKNFYYLTGHEHRQAALCMKKTTGCYDTFMYVIQLTPLQTHWLGHLPSPAEVKSATGIDHVNAISDLPGQLVRLLNNVDTLFLDLNPTSIHEPLNESLQFAETVRRTHPHLTIRNAASLLAMLREIKTDWECDRIREAVAITHKGMTRMLHHMKAGIHEYEMDAWFNLELQLNKTCTAFPTIAAAGKNATILHYTSLNDPLQDGDLLLLDLGAEYEHYSADISRTFPINGTFSPQQRQLYDLVLDANVTAIETVKPGITLQELNAITRDVLAKGMRTLGYIEDDNEIANFYTHGVSHSLGLDTHDCTSGTRQTLIPGVVLTIEPGLYLENEGIGIRIEDDVVVTESGCKNLSAIIPKKAEAVENWIREAQSVNY